MPWIRADEWATLPVMTGFHQPSSHCLFILFPLVDPPVQMLSPFFWSQFLLIKRKVSICPNPVASAATHCVIRAEMAWVVLNTHTEPHARTCTQPHAYCRIWTHWNGGWRQKTSVKRHGHVPTLSHVIIWCSLFEAKFLLLLAPNAMLQFQVCYWPFIQDPMVKCKTTPTYWPIVIISKPTPYVNTQRIKIPVEQEPCGVTMINDLCISNWRNNFVKRETGDCGNNFESSVYMHLGCVLFTLSPIVVRRTTCSQGSQTWAAMAPVCLLLEVWAWRVLWFSHWKYGSWSNVIWTFV